MCVPRVLVVWTHARNTLRLRDVGLSAARYFFQWGGPLLPGISITRGHSNARPPARGQKSQAALRCPPSLRRRSARPYRSVATRERERKVMKELGERPRWMNDPGGKRTLIAVKEARTRKVQQREVMARDTRLSRPGSTNAHAPHSPDRTQNAPVYKLTSADCY